MNKISGFSKLSKDEKLSWLSKESCIDVKSLRKFWLDSHKEQKTLDDLSENTVSNFIVPYGLAPNFKINDHIYTVPMVIEESSVVAAASKAAKFWCEREGFKARVLGTTKLGHVHFFSEVKTNDLAESFNEIKIELIESVDTFNKNMKNRGGGLLSLELIDKTSSLKNYFQLEAKFETCDAMGANFINTMLENIALTFKNILSRRFEYIVDINMSILSNYTPECLVEARVSCSINELEGICTEISGIDFAKKFKAAVDIAGVDISRAVTHNKGILNGIDAVVLATGNDFRAVESACHAFASKDGDYKSLSTCEIKDEQFTFKLTIPMSIGTVGGLTSLHPLAKESLKLLGNPSATELMKIIACVGLAQNFGAISSLVTTGIQKGHMKMHLLNILNQLNASDDQIIEAKKYFEKRIVSFNEVRSFLNIH